MIAIVACTHAIRKTASSAVFRLCLREELNLNLLLRRETSYPLNYEGAQLLYYKTHDLINGRHSEDGRNNIEKNFLSDREFERSATDGNDE
jgi:hypothetical protein